MKRIVMISDSFHRYVTTSRQSDRVPDTLKILSAIKQAQKNGKLFRFWGTPDTREMWLNLVSWHVDLISTDNVIELSAFLQTK